MEQRPVDRLDSLELDQLRARQPEACEAFVAAHYRGVYRFFLWLTNDAESAADLTQETFAAFWASTDDLDAGRVPDPRAWLYGIARNRWRKRCRDAPPPCLALEAAAELMDDAAGPEALAIAVAEADAVARAVASLPPDYREALVLRVFQELSYREIAAGLGVREELARWRVHQARIWLRAALRSEAAKEACGASRA